MDVVWFLFISEIWWYPRLSKEPLNKKGLCQISGTAGPNSMRTSAFYQGPGLWLIAHIGFDCPLETAKVIFRWQNAPLDPPSFWRKSLAAAVKLFSAEKDLARLKMLPIFFFRLITRPDLRNQLGSIPEMGILGKVDTFFRRVGIKKKRKKKGMERKIHGC